MIEILIIGCNGFIGHHAYNFFSKNDEYHVTGCDITDNLDKDNFKLISPLNFDFESLFSENKFDVCLNASGMANVALSEKDPLKDYEANVVNTIQILDAIRKNNSKCKFINLSSAAVYGNPDKLPITEDLIPNPISIYGYHKLQAELLCKEYAKIFNLNTISLRLFSVYGEGLKKQLLWDLSSKINSEGTILSMFGKKDDSRDYIYILELMNVIKLVIEKVNFDGKAINVANGIETTIEEIVTSYSKISNCNKQIEFTNEYLPGYPSKWQADISSLKEIGYKSSVTLEQGLKSYYGWVKKLK